MPSIILPPEALMLQQYLHRPGCIPASVHPFVKQAALTFVSQTALTHKMRSQKTFGKPARRFPWRGWLMLIGCAISSLSQSVTRRMRRC
ncbi:hypothetical protein [Adonisia turfae]|uniref:hypothetical protein n=1 Tax=Adonisia turfae TaxID=2950184 RepID=UPI0013D11279|nr:hypothetical protein [Adonisia turfae]